MTRFTMHFEGDVWVAAPIETVFGFFADAANLERITPPWLRFRVVTPPPIAIARGTLIDYRLRVHGVPLVWRSEITVWEPPHRFVDEQRRGPYRSWRHTHTFQDERGGTRVSDRVEFLPPFSLLTGWFVRRDVNAIFAYRRQALLSIFPPPAG